MAHHQPPNGNYVLKLADTGFVLHDRPHQAGEVPNLHPLVAKQLHPGPLDFFTITHSAGNYYDIKYQGHDVVESHGTIVVNKSPAPHNPTRWNIHPAAGGNYTIADAHHEETSWTVDDGAGPDRSVTLWVHGRQNQSFTFTPHH